MQACIVAQITQQLHNVDSFEGLKLLGKRRAVQNYIKQIKQKSTVLSTEILLYISLMDQLTLQSTCDDFIQIIAAFNFDISLSQWIPTQFGQIVCQMSLTNQLQYFVKYIKNSRLKLCKLWFECIDSNNIQDWDTFIHAVLSDAKEEFVIVAVKYLEPLRHRIKLNQLPETIKQWWQLIETLLPKVSHNVDDLNKVVNQISADLDVLSDEQFVQFKPYVHFFYACIADLICHYASIYGTVPSKHLFKLCHWDLNKFRCDYVSTVNNFVNNNSSTMNINSLDPQFRIFLSIHLFKQQYYEYFNSCGELIGFYPFNSTNTSHCNMSYLTILSILSTKCDKITTSTFCRLPSLHICSLIRDLLTIKATNFILFCRILDLMSKYGKSFGDFTIQDMIDATKRDLNPCRIVFNNDSLFIMPSNQQISFQYDCVFWCNKFENVLCNIDGHQTVMSCIFNRTGSISNCILIKYDEISHNCQYKGRFVYQDGTHGFIYNHKRWSIQHLQLFQKDGSIYDIDTLVHHLFNPESFITQLAKATVTNQFLKFNDTSQVVNHHPASTHTSVVYHYTGFNVSRKTYTLASLVLTANGASYCTFNGITNNLHTYPNNTLTVFIKLSCNTDFCTRDQLILILKAQFPKIICECTEVVFSHTPMSLMLKWQPCSPAK